MTLRTKCLRYRRVDTTEDALVSVKDKEKALALHRTCKHCGEAFDSLITSERPKYEPGVEVDESEYTTLIEHFTPVKFVDSKADIRLGFVVHDCKDKVYE